MPCTRLSYRLLGTVAVAALATPLAFAQVDAGGASNVASPPAASSGARLPAPGLLPSRSDTAMEAFGKLNRGHADYLTYDDVQQLDGFGAAFAQADQNGDGRLNAAEFNSAWALYTGSTP